jgi:5-methylcytosine-specific restriction enzyme subunit McrC
MSSSFRRTPDFGPNRLLRHALEKLLARYSGINEQNQRVRTLRLRKALLRLGDVQKASASDLTPQAIARYMRQLPTHHEHYVDAFMVAHLIAYDLGLSIRKAGGVAILPSILIDMASVFESYMRRVLADGFADDPAIRVKDGNREGSGGAKLLLYDPIQAGFKNPDVTPDIVIEVNEIPALVIDAKYKPAPKLPDRSDVNQVLVYGVRYATPRVMLLHAGRASDRALTELCGSIGGYEIYNGMVDLNAVSIADEERAFVASVRALL